MTVLQLSTISDLTLTSCETRPPKWLPAGVSPHANTATVIRRGTGAELSRKAPRLYTMIYSLYGASNEMRD